jgi:hypothetical protein
MNSCTVTDLLPGRRTFIVNASDVEERYLASPLKLECWMTQALIAGVFQGNDAVSALDLP